MRLTQEQQLNFIRSSYMLPFLPQYHFLNSGKIIQKGYTGYRCKSCTGCIQLCTKKSLQEGTNDFLELKHSSKEPKRGAAYDL